MSRDLRQKLVFHGAIVVLLGLLAGFPYAFVRTGAIAGEARAWSMAHLEGLLNGILLIAVAAISRRLALDKRRHAILAWALIVTAYGNLVAAVLAATFGVRGLEATGPAANWLVYGLFMLALIAVFVAIGLVIYGARPGGRTTIERVTVDVDTGVSVSTNDAAGGDEAEAPAAPSGGRAARRRSKRRK